ncbi:hypothetical protein [Saccharothrix syringae]|uniref:Uncharacterized protein n=1 Tax=Saccharothrix syringae TaxID=103733 RepID=A0A5Q0GV88_SACSY|nr:hypothetical protein [Saccharothrix syringae]QFZ17831.1 hypothetical protein EKG83_10365 [Saccharothrix syringae]
MISSYACRPVSTDPDAYGEEKWRLNNPGTDPRTDPRTAVSPGHGRLPPFLLPHQAETRRWGFVCSGAPAPGRVSQPCFDTRRAGSGGEVPRLP